MKYFTSDWHLGEDRIGINGNPNLFYRPFASIGIQDYVIIDNVIRSGFVDGDEIIHLGDVVYDFNNKNSINELSWLRDKFPKSTFTLIIGNYDEDVTKLKMLGRYFDVIKDDFMIEVQGKSFYLNHYPANCIDKSFSITGHIHGLWKVQKNMINVGVDAWHFKPVSENTIMFCRNAVEKYYDKNVFPY